MNRRVPWSWLAPLLLCSGCTAVTGYTPDVPRQPSPPELRSPPASSETSLDYGAPAVSEGAADKANPRKVALTKVLGEAQERAYGVLEAAAELESAAGRAQAAQGALLPRVGIQAGATYIDGRQVGSLGPVQEVSFARFVPAVSVFYQVNPGAALARSAGRRRAADAANRATAAWWDLLGPEIDASVGKRLIGTKIDDLRDTTLARAFITLSLGFDELGRAKAAGASARAAAIREQALRAKVHGEIETAVSKVNTANQAILEAQAGVVAARKSYQAQLARFKAGTGLGLEVIEAQNAQARTRLELAQAIIQYNIAQIELAASMGRLTPNLLGRGP